MSKARGVAQTGENPGGYGQVDRQGIRDLSFHLEKSGQLHNYRVQVVLWHYISVPKSVLGTEFLVYGSVSSQS